MTLELAPLDPPQRLLCGPGPSNVEPSVLEAMQRTHCQVPIILITALDNPGLRQEAQRRGVAAYLVKPFGGPELLEAIGQVGPRSCRGS